LPEWPSTLLHTRFDRKLLGKLAACAWTCLQAEVRHQLGRDDVTPGMIAAIQTHGELLHWHPHIHTLVTCGAFTPEGDFLDVPQFDIERLQASWREAVFALYLAEEKIAPEAVENMRGWPHSGFSVDQSVYLPTGDRPGIERLVQYMIRCPFSLSRLVKVTGAGQVVYKAEKDACRRFPDPRGDVMTSGVKRNFQVLDPLEFLAEFTQHIPPKGSHLIRYYGWYSNKSRGMRRKAAEAIGGENGNVPLEPRGRCSPTSPLLSGEGQGVRAGRCSATWAMLIKRVYEVDPLKCPKCSGRMKVIAFIEPPQGTVIEKILRHCGLWQPSMPRPPPVEEDRPASSWSASDDFADDVPPESFDQSNASDDWTYVDVDAFGAAF